MRPSERHGRSLDDNPSRSLRAVRRLGTVELLLTMPVTIPQALLGKYLASWLFIAIALVLTFPIVATANWLGDPDNGVIATGYMGSLLLAGTYLALTCLTSALTRNQVASVGGPRAGR